jgi:hypothetical protein
VPRLRVRHPFHEELFLTTAIIVGLSAAVVFIGKKWLDARTEVAELRTAIVTLKRRLKLR